jgi:hypothetical protein
MVGTLKEKGKSSEIYSANARKERAVLLYRRLINNASKHGVKLIFNTKNKVKKAVIAPGNWKPVTFDVFIKNDNLMIKNKEWGYNEMDLLIPQINNTRKL